MSSIYSVEDILTSPKLRSAAMVRPKNTGTRTIRPATAGSYPFSGKIAKPVPHTRRQRLAEFADYTGVSGVYNIKRSKSWFRRVIWILAFLTAWGVLIWQVYGTFAKYFKYPINVVVSMRFDANAEFPAVTICNLNPVRRKEYNKISDEIFATEYYDPFEDYEILDLTFDELEGGNGSVHTFDDGEEFIINAEAAYKKKMLRVIYDHKLNLDLLGHQMHEMLVDCSYQTTQCFPGDFYNFTHGQYGLCYSIRFNSSKFPTRTGPDNGLSLTLLVQKEEYVPRLTPAVGFKVDIHDPHLLPSPEDNGFTISPGFETSVGMRKLNIQRQPLPYNGTDCVDINIRAVYQNKSIYLLLEETLNITTVYSSSACLKSCYTIALAQHCGCVDASIVTFKIASATLANFTRACDLGYVDDIACIRDLLYGKLTNGTKICSETDCPNACEENSYQLSVTTSSWPTDAFLEASLDTYVQRSPKSVVDDIKETLLYAFEDDAEILEKLNKPHFKLTKAFINLIPYEEKINLLEHFRENLVKLNVYFKELNYESIVETPAMELLDLLINLGGTVGLWVGMCMLTFLEVLELLFDLIFFRSGNNV